MKTKFHIILSCLIFSACSTKGVLSIPVSYCKTEKEIEISADSSFNSEGFGILNCIDLQIIQDTIMVVQRQVYGDEPYHFGLFSTTNWRHLTDLARQGKGPGEIIYPNLTKSTSSADLLSFRDNATGVAYIYYDNTSTQKKVETPVYNILDWLPLQNNRSFYLTYQDKFQCILTNNNIVEQQYDIWGNFKSEDYTPLLSSVLAADDGKVAMALLCFPQLILFDTGRMEVKSVTTSQDYKKWRNIMNTPLTPMSKQYYSSIASSDNYIFALFSNDTILNIMRGSNANTIHIFNWDGQLLHSLTPDRHIDKMTFDQKSKLLYAIDKDSGQLVRFNLGHLL